MNYKNKEILKEIYSLGTKLLAQRNQKYNWDAYARPSQKIPKHDWYVWLIMAGRGFGKTRTGAESIKKFVQIGYKNICLLGKTRDEVKRVMIEGKSGLLSVYPDNEKPKFYPSKNIIEWDNGAIAEIHSADSYESLRGPQFDVAWVDELAKFNNVDEVWDQLMMTMRLGDPKVIVTTTPKPISLLNSIMEKDDTYCTRGSTFENKTNLSDSYINHIKEQYGSTQFGKQEIYGELIDDVKMWSDANIHYATIDSEIDLKNKIDHIIELKKLNIIIAVDPAVSSNDHSDETGIIALGKYDNNIYILEDASGRWADWYDVCIRLCEKYKTKTVVAEINQGGDMIKDLLHIKDSTLKFHGVRSMVSKVQRAQPIACLYDQKKVFHMHGLSVLESQMKNFPQKIKSPDRVDAMVIGVNYLMKQSNAKKNAIFVYGK